MTAQAIETRQGHDRNGHGAEHESAVPQACAQSPNYALGFTLPNHMSRTLATAVILGLLPVSFSVWMGWL